MHSIRCLLLISVISVGVPSSADEPLQFNRDIRPILAEYCFQCHGPDSASRQADLRLDDFDAAVDQGALVPGEPDESEILRRIESEDESERMPPPETEKSPSPQQVARLRQWIEEGAEYQPHWSLIAPQRPPLPDVDPRYAEWVRNPIDRFIVQRVVNAGLEPSPEADRRTLARRVALDLTGLPPKPEVVEAFVHDTAPDAYERLVDRFLASPQWGEHRARYWLDYARYADTHGIHFDNYREMWSYRDWVIAAFNENMPFDQFTIENLAGDLLQNPTLKQQIASGFNRCNITTNEGGAIDEEYLVLYTRDRTETTAQVWLGLTAGCAVCHSHKFDPISHHEFYALAAFFNNTTQKAMDGNIADTPPIVPVPRDEDAQRFVEVTRELERQRQVVDQRRENARPEFEQWLDQATAEEILARAPREGIAFQAPLEEREGRTIQVTVPSGPRSIELAETATWQPGDESRSGLSVQGSAWTVDDVGDFERDRPFSCSAWIRVPANDTSGAICARMDDQNGYRGWDLWIQQRRIGLHLIHQWSSDALKVVAAEPVPADQWVHVAMTYDGSSTSSGVRIYYDGKLQATNVENDNLKNTTRTSVPFRVGQRQTAAEWTGSISDIRVYDRPLPESEVLTLALADEFLRLVKLPADQRDQESMKSLYAWWLNELDETFRTESALRDALDAESAEIRRRGTIAHVMHEGDDAAKAYVLFRGEYEQRRDEVAPDTPAVLPPFPDSFPRNRFGFAQWLLLPQHPLTARVTVNRYWQELFGTGLVRTPGDFGVMGELPTHPELLDWLAVEFRESDWDVKAFYRLLVTSATYRQSAHVTERQLQIDPDNRLLSRGARFRMDAEMVRDQALATSGLLVDRLGGPSVRPYQPSGVWEAVAMIGSNTREYQQDHGEGLYRRSMYTLWKRAAPPASMEIFNAPSRETCTVRRERTNTPIQSLATLNDIQFVEAARVLAERALSQASASDDDTADFIARRLLARPLQLDELQVVHASLAGLREYYRQTPDDAKRLVDVGEWPRKTTGTVAVEELAAWTMLTNQLMNLDEVLVK